MNSRFSVSERIFFSAYGIWMTTEILKITYLNDLPYFSEASAFAGRLVWLLLLAKLVVDSPHSRRELLGIAVLALLYLDFQISGRQNLLFPMYFVYSARNVPLKRIFSFTLILQAILMVCVIAAAAAGVIENEVWVEGEPAVRERYALGYTYCTYPSHLLLFMTLLYICVRGRIAWYETILLISANYLMYLFTDTRTDLMLSVPLILAAWIWCRKSGTIRQNIISRICIQYSFLLAAAASIALQFFYDPGNRWMSKLNTALNGRLTFGRSAIENYGIGFFGKYVRWVGRGSLKAYPEMIYNYVDNAFLQLTISCGLIFLLFLAVAFVWAAGRALRDAERPLCLALIGVIGFSMIDAELCALTFNTFLFAASGIFEERGKGIKECIQNRKKAG